MRVVNTFSRYDRIQRIREKHEEEEQRRRKGRTGTQIISGILGLVVACCLLWQGLAWLTNWMYPPTIVTFRAVPRQELNPPEPKIEIRNGPDYKVRVDI